jgi:hypothetical protein
MNFLQENWDIYAWKPFDMPGVPRKFIEHELHVDPKAKSVKQRLQPFAQVKKQVLFVKCSTRIGLPMRSLYQKRIVIGGCVSIIPVSIMPGKRIPSGFLKSIKSWTPQLGAVC